METITYVYRAYSCLNELCYVGITKNFDIRLNAHRNDKPWWEHEVDYLIIKTFRTRAEAEIEEEKAISSEYPKYNELKGKTAPSSISVKELADRLTPAKTRLPLPQGELDYLKSLEEPKVYERAAALQEAGWPASEILKGVKISPTPIQLRTAIKITRGRDESLPIPQPPLSRQEKKAIKQASAVHLSSSDKSILQHLSKQVKKYRPGHPLGHPLYEAREQYNNLIKRLHASGVSTSELASACGVDDSNIRRRLR